VEITQPLEERFMFKLSEIEEAAALVHRHVPPTPQHRWPLLAERTGCEVWVKHENHTPIGAFKLRGGITYLSDLRRRRPEVPGVITATRGNHGQSIASAAALLGLRATVVVPEGNSVEKNAAMKAQGAELVVHGHDFQAALEYTRERAAAEGLVMVESFEPGLILGVASYGLELFGALAGLDTVYVPIGLGSGICGTMAARDALGVTTKVVGVVAENAAAYALSYARGKPVSTNAADTLADGMACRVPVAEAVALINAGAERIVTVSELEIKAAVRAYYTDTHNIAEGAGAAPLAALIKEKHKMAGKKVALVLSGGNIDKALYREILAED
jgi:threonine dehydratase